MVAMAKSLRSKRKRKLRAEKRIVNAKKELVKLKSIVSHFSKANAEEAGVNLSKFKDIVASKKARLAAGEPNTSPASDIMEIDQGEASGSTPKQSGGDGGGKGAKVLAGQNLPLKNEHGNYPVWMNKKKIKLIKQKIKRHNKNKGKKAGQITSRKAKKQVKRLGSKSNKPKKL